MGMVAPVYYTVDMVRALPDDGNRYEVVHGELLVTPAPRPWHEELVGRLYDVLQKYLRLEPVGHAFGSRADITWVATSASSRMCSSYPWTRPAPWIGARCATCCSSRRS